MSYFVVSYKRSDETLHGIHVAGNEPTYNSAVQIFRVRSNAFMFIAFLHGNARIELQDLMNDDVGGVAYFPASFTGSISDAAKLIARQSLEQPKP